MRDSDTGRSAAACAGDALANWWAGRESNPNFFLLGTQGQDRSVITP